MCKDHRNSERMKLELQSNIYPPNTDVELSAITEDISENGIQFRLDCKYAKYFADCDNLKFLICDNIGGHMVSVVASGSIRHCHVQNGNLYVGCHVCDSEFQRFNTIESAFFWRRTQQHIRQHKGENSNVHNRT